MTSSVAKLWPSNWSLGIRWLLAIFKFFHVTFVKTFPTQGDVVAGGGGSRLDENGNPVPACNSGSASSSATPDQSSSQKVCHIPAEEELHIPRTSTDGRSTRIGKDGSRRSKTTAKGIQQSKPKTQKSKKNESNANGTGSLEPEIFHSCPEITNTKQICKDEAEQLEEFCGDGNEKQEVSSESLVLDELSESEFKDTEITSVGEYCSRVPTSSNSDHEGKGLVDMDPVEVYTEKTSEEAKSSNKGRPRKKRRKGKGTKQSAINTDSLTVEACKPVTEHKVVESKPASDKNSDVVVAVVPSCTSPSKSFNSIGFSSVPSEATRQKPSARVHPSRSAIVNSTSSSSEANDHGSTEKDPSLHLGIDQQSDKTDMWSSAGDPFQKNFGCLSPVDIGKEAHNVFTEESGHHSDVVTCHLLRNLASESAHLKGVSSEVNSSVSSEREDIFPVDILLSPPLPVLYKQTFPNDQICQTAKVKPQSLVNPFSVTEASNLKAQHHVVNPSSKVGMATGVRFETPIEMKPKVCQPPRFRPRSTVNPLHLESPRTRFRPQCKTDRMSGVSQELRTTPVSEPNVAFRDSKKKETEYEHWRRTPTKCLQENSKAVTSMPNCADSCHTDSRQSFVATNQCHRSCQYRSCPSDTCHLNCGCSESTLTATKQYPFPRKSHVSGKKKKVPTATLR